ncbi:hypothetical protein LOD99_5074 [Oopsacas minuta]|uniref:RWD domain-containing protein n=1 Tax=Oopsacas minuta TaxID=111878 RepID=A0AAV7JS08_9METZ|nr:hypothetical protein LOD99_5074 [Oopsacas minuta]
MNEAQREELSALEAVYPDELSIINKLHNTYSMHLEESGHSLTLYFEFHSDYPAVLPPRFQLESFGLDEIAKAELRNELLSQFETESGVLFNWVEHIIEFLSHLPPVLVHSEISHDTPAYSLPNKPQQPVNIPEIHPPPILQESDNCYELKIFHGEPLTDRKSVFQSHACRVSSVTEVDHMLTALKSNKKIAQATHNILAYRFIDKERGVLMQDCDDDKEHGAGGRLSHLLQFSGAEGVAVVVTRWYGGIQLGPDRFKHINNVARTLLVECGFIQGTADKGGKKKKK